LKILAAYLHIVYLGVIEGKLHHFSVICIKNKKNRGKTDKIEKSNNIGIEKNKFFTKEIV
jgi:hypothetical protein